MKYIKPINEFFGPFKKKSEFDKIAIEFINRMSKVKDYNTPYTITMSAELPPDGNILEHMGIVRYQIQFDDVFMDISNKTTVDLPSSHEHYNLVIDGEDIDCDEKYSKKLFKLIDNLYEKDKKDRNRRRNSEKEKSNIEKANRLRQNINPAADLLDESFREEKKPKSEYFTKRIDITKMELEDICSELDLPFEDIKFLSAGSFGNAYKLGNKVLKITTDKREAKTVYNLLNKKQNESVIKYYDVSRYKLKNQYVYVIIMDYARPLVDYIKSIKNVDMEEYTEHITEFFFENWDKITSVNDIKDWVSSEYDIPDSGFGKVIIDKFWRLYNNLKYLDECPDMHVHNLGFKEDGELVLFDFCDFGVVNKFDLPRIIAKSKLESVDYSETSNKIGLLQDLTNDLSDEGIYVDIKLDDPRFKRKRGVEYIYLSINDKDRVAVGRGVIANFIKKLDDLGIERGKDYKIHGNGNETIFEFEGDGLKSIRL